MSTRREKSINIKGMHCASCVALIENRVKSLKGVNNISVNLATEDANLIFDNSKISFENIKNSYIIYGHYHIQKDIYEDENYNKHHIIGVPIETRNGENQKHKIIYIKDTLQEISLPLYFTFENIQYGEFPKNKNNILNIKNAPSLKAVYELYKGYYIREEGIEINRSQSLEIDDITNKQHKSFNEITLQEKFKLFIDYKNINNERVVKECLLRISNNG